MIESQIKKQKNKQNKNSEINKDQAFILIEH